MGNRITDTSNSMDGKVLVTGHTGFKGTWLALMFDKFGVDWAGISLPPQESSMYNLISFEKKVEEHLLDIRNYDALKKAVISINPKYVIHLAGQALVLNSYREPRKTFETNVLGTWNLLDVVTKFTPAKKIAVATTDKVYKSQKFRNKFKESAALGGMDPYSWSKVGTESVIGAWQQLSKYQNGTKIFSLRSGNVIGGGDRSESRLMPDLVNSFISNTEIVIRNPESTRPWQHVLDVLYGYFLALKTDTNESVFNFAPTTKSLTVREVVEIASKTWGQSVKVNYKAEQSGLETKNLSLNAKLAQRELGWQSSWNQKTSVISTVKWWQNVLSKQLTPNEACMKDIQELVGGNLEK
jgi:CDP-glucose 4,6-dehydratase